MTLALESRSSACHSCSHPLAAEALFCPNCGTAKKRDLSEDPLIGQRIGDRYLLTDRIGLGASGTIYLGEHVTLRRKVCVKVLHHELSRDDLAIERFRRQATTVSDLDNEHIVAVHDFGRAPDGRLYIAMEYLEGETLDDRISRGPLADDETVSVLTQVGEALIEAHAIGYVHRDLRPRNLFLSVRRGSANFVKLLDFGLSKLVASEGSADSTSLGMTFGDPRYMSPEQARGEPVDRRADIYSMGCIAYQMLTGEPPFTGQRVFDVLTRHVEETPVPLDQRAKLPVWLNDTIMRCLEKRPEDRFATVFRLVEALREGAVSGEAMDPDRAIRRETVQPASVSRIIERFGDRLGADGMIDDADDLRTNSAEPSNPKSNPKSELFSGARTAMGIGVAPTAAEVAAHVAKTQATAADANGRVARAMDDAPTTPSGPPIISGETKGLPQVKSDRHLLQPSVQPSARVGVPSHVEAEPTPPPRSRPNTESGPAFVGRSDSAGSEALVDAHLASAVAAPEPKGPKSAAFEETLSEGSEEAEADAASEHQEITEEERREFEEAVAKSRRENDDPSGPRSLIIKESDKPGKDSRSSSSLSGPVGKRTRRQSSSGESKSGISSAWFSDGDALEDSALSLDEKELAKLEKARRGRRTARTGLSATDEIYYEEPPSRLKWIVGAIAAAAAIGLVIFLWTRSGDEIAANSADGTDGTDGTDANGAATNSNSDPNGGMAGSAAETPATAIDAGTTVAVAATKPVDKKPVDKKPVDKKPVDKKPVDKKPVDKKPVDKKPVDKKPVDKKPVDEKPVDPYGDPKDDPKDPRPSEDDKTKANYFAQIGSTKLRGGDIPGAAINFRKALALNPSNSAAVTGLGEIALKQGSYSAAVKHLSRAAKMRKGSARTHALLGDAKAGTGDKSGAVTSYRRALEINPELTRAKRGLARLGIES